MQGHFSLQAMGELFGRKDPHFSSALPLSLVFCSWAGLASLIFLPPILAHGTVAPSSPAFHLSVLPCGEYHPFPPPRCCTGFIFVVQSASVPAGD